MSWVKLEGQIEVEFMEEGRYLNVPLSTRDPGTPSKSVEIIACSW